MLLIIWWIERVSLLDPLSLPPVSLRYTHKENEVDDKSGVLRDIWGSLDRAGLFDTSEESILDGIGLERERCP